MRKKLTIALIVLAVAIYVYDTLLVVNFHRGGGDAVKAAPLKKGTAARLLPAVHFTVATRSPFSEQPVSAASFRKKKQGDTIPQNPAPPPVVKIKEPAKPVELPRIIVTGIMWHPVNPVAMLQLENKSTVIAKPGQKILDSITVKTIEKNAVLLVYKKREMRIRP